MATNKKVIKEIRSNAVRFAMICMVGAIERQLVNCTTRLVRSQLRLPYNANLIILYFFDNFLICGHWPLIFDTLTSSIDSYKNFWKLKLSTQVVPFLVSYLYIMYSIAVSFSIILVRTFCLAAKIVSIATAGEVYPYPQMFLITKIKTVVLRGSRAGALGFSSDYSPVCRTCYSCLLY